MSAAAGMVVTEMKTPISALARASVSETTPTMPARTATTTENRFGLSIRLETGRTPAEYSLGVCPDQRMTKLKSSVTMMGEEAAQDRPPALLVDAERHAHDRVVFRPDDHGSHDEDLRIGQDADRADHPGESQENIETGRVDGIRTDSGLDHRPYRRSVPLHYEMF
jgi:hypothetical protein